MKITIISVLTAFLLLVGAVSRAQLKAGSEGIFIQEGTVFSTDGLTLVPSADLFINNTTVVKDFSVVIWPKYNSILRMYRFSRPITFEGEIAMNYQETELNGNNPKNLAMAYSKTTSNNYKDFTMVKETVVDPNLRFIGQFLPSPVVFADLTAVSLESTLAAYTDLIPNNMITPNGDGVNDTWIVKNINLYPNNEVKIFDREGRIVYTKNSYDNSWDGKYNGNPLPEDTYYFILSLDSGKAKRTGFISIVKE